ncbi:hypothetical protein [Thiolapillus sp.]
MRDRGALARGMRGRVGCARFWQLKSKKKNSSRKKKKKKKKTSGAL